MPAKTAARNGVKPALLEGGLDLDALLAERRLEPVPVTLGGHTYRVRRDLRRREMQAFFAQLNRGIAEGDVQAFAILFSEGDPDDLSTYDKADAQLFCDFTDQLPKDLETLAVQKVLIAAKVRTEADFEQAETGDSGESKASSPA